MDTPAVRDAVLDPDRDATLLAVLGVTAFALAVRLYDLGGRIMHWDEGRVGYWILRYQETGQYHYRPITHGPFLPVVNAPVFDLIGASDFSARLVVALVGGLLPLVALALRHRLGDDETVALALALAVNPLLVYYSRFMRNDVLVAGFALGAFALVVLAVDRGRALPLYPAAVLLAVGFASKENAVVYVLCLLGAGVLLLDHRLLRRTGAGESPRAVVRSWADDAAGRLRAWGGTTRRGGGLAVGHAVGTLATFLVVVVFFYAPRPDLWRALAAPSRLPGVVTTATVGSWSKFVGTWVGGPHQSHTYLPFLYDYLETLAFGAPAVLLFATVGFVADGYLDGRRRELVAFTAYWGAVSVVGYPVATDIRAPWAAVHAVVPLAVPAAVGVAFCYREVVEPTAVGRPAVADGGRPERLPVREAVLALLLVAAAAGVGAANATYHNSTDRADDRVLQYAQPGNELKPAIRRAERAIRATDAGPAPDVLYYGVRDAGGNTQLYVRDESSADQPPVGGPSWHSRLPLPWYFERADAEVTSTPPDAAVPADPPPVVVTMPQARADLERPLDGYVVGTYRFRLWGKEVVVFVDRSALRGA